MCSGSRFSVSKKSGCAGLFRQIHKKCLRQGTQTPRPPGKAGRYELTLEGCGPPNLSKGFSDSLKTGAGARHVLRRLLTKCRVQGPSRLINHAHS